jgi:hypothetical protein
MLDGIPLGSTGGIVSNGYGQGKGVGQLGLELGFPGVAAAPGGYHAEWYPYRDLKTPVAGSRFIERKRDSSNGWHAAQNPIRPARIRVEKSGELPATLAAALICSRCFNSRNGSPPVTNRPRSYSNSSNVPFSRNW